MGPYCNFCGRRCFCYLPDETPIEALSVYGTITIIATCPDGQRFEKERLGWCYDAIRDAIAGQRQYDLDSITHRYAIAAMTGQQPRIEDYVRAYPQYERELLEYALDMALGICALPPHEEPETLALSEAGERALVEVHRRMTMDDK